MDTKITLDPRSAKEIYDLLKMADYDREAHKIRRDILLWELDNLCWETYRAYVGTDSFVRDTVK